MGEAAAMRKKQNQLGMRAKAALLSSLLLALCIMLSGCALFLSNVLPRAVSARDAAVKRAMTEGGDPFVLFRFFENPDKKLAEKYYGVRRSLFEAGPEFGFLDYTGNLSFGDSRWEYFEKENVELTSGALYVDPTETGRTKEDFITAAAAYFNGNPDYRFIKATISKYSVNYFWEGPRGSQVYLFDHEGLDGVDVYYHKAGYWNEMRGDTILTEWTGPLEYGIMAERQEEEAAGSSSGSGTGSGSGSTGSSSGSSSGGSSGSSSSGKERDDEKWERDHYNVHDYATPDDFYYDWYDDFDSYEDAELYFDDYGD